MFQFLLLNIAKLGVLQLPLSDFLLAAAANLMKELKMQELPDTQRHVFPQFLLHSRDQERTS